VPIRTFDRAATHPYEVQTATRATMAKPSGSSKAGLVIGAILLVLTVAAAWYFIFNRNHIEPVKEGEVTTPSTVPEGMVLIPQGTFMMGRNLTEEEKKFWLGDRKKPTYVFSYDWPAHKVDVSAFYLDQTEVSNRQYQEFVKASGHAPPENWTGAAPPL